MKRARVMLLTICSATAAAGPDPAAKLATLDADNGFRDATFGTPFATLKELVFVRNDSGLKVYKRPTDALTIGRVTLAAIEYGFDPANTLQVIHLRAGEDDSSRIALKDYCWNRYGFSEFGRGWYRSIGKKIYLGFVTYGPEAGAWISPVAFWERRNEAATRGNLISLQSAVSIFYGDQEGIYPPTLGTSNGSVMEVYLETVPSVRATHMDASTGTAESPEGSEVLVTTDENITGPGRGWRYNPVTGHVHVNSAVKDARGVPYSSYGY